MQEPILFFLFLVLLVSTLAIFLFEDLLYIVIILVHSAWPCFNLAAA